LNLDLARAVWRQWPEKGKREFNSPFFPLSRGSTAIIALQAGRTNRAWSDLSDARGSYTVKETAGIEFESF